MFLLEGNPSPPGRGVGGAGERGTASSGLGHSAASRLRPTSCSTDNLIRRLVSRCWRIERAEVGTGELWAWKRGEAAAPGARRGAGSRQGRNRDPQDVHSCRAGGGRGPHEARNQTMRGGAAVWLVLASRRGSHEAESGSSIPTYQKLEPAAETGRVTYCRPLLPATTAGLAGAGSCLGQGPFPQPAAPLALPVEPVLGRPAKLKCRLHGPSPAPPSWAELGREGHALRQDLMTSPAYVSFLPRLLNPTLCQEMGQNLFPCGNRSLEVA